MKFLLVGHTGYWGQKLGRVLTELGHKFSGIDHSNSDLLDTEEADAAIIATPPATHYDMALRAMRAGLDVLVEKPMTMRPRDAERLVDFALSGHLVLSVDSTFLHTAAFEYLKGLNEPLLRYQSVRISPPMPQAQIPAGWDMLAHDIAILEGLIGDGMSYETSYENDDMALAALRLHDGVAFLLGSRAWHEKIREIVLRYPSASYVWTLEGLKTYEGEWVVREDEPLKQVIKDFVQRCQNRELRGLTDGQHGANVVRRLEELFPHRAVGDVRYRDVGQGLQHRATVQHLPMPHRTSS